MTFQALLRWRRRLRLLLRRDAVERSMDAEMRHHLECETAEYIRHGLAPDEARRRAARDFGGVDAVKEDARGTRAAADRWRISSSTCATRRVSFAATRGSRPSRS